MKPTLLLALASLGVAARAEIVHGTLVDDSGRPLAGVRLSGYGIWHSASGRFQFADLRATTGRDGAFQLTGAPTKPTEAVPVMVMARLTDGRFAPVRLTEEGGRATWRPVATATLTVRAFDAAGAPLPGATAQATNVILSDPATPKDALTVYQASLPEGGPGAVTDAQGVARIAGIPVGATAQYRVTRAGRLSDKGQTDLAAGGAEVKATLGTAAILSGRVLREGRPVPNVDVVASTLTDRTMRQVRAKTDATGTYRIADAYPGSVSLSAELGPLAQTWVANGPGRIVVGPGQERDGLNLTLDHGVVLSGTVLTRDGGKPVPGAKVWASGPDEGRVDRVADAQGRFSLRGAPGDWYVAVDEVGDRRLNAQVNLRATVDAAHNPPLELRLPDAALLAPIPHLAGTVVDASGQPVAGATVRNLMGGATTTTDAAGRFRFESSTDPGGFLIAAKGDAMSTRAVRVLDHPEVGLALDGRAASVHGILTDDAGKPLPGVAVTLGGQMDGGYLNVPDTTTDAEGAYRFESLYGGVDSFFLWAKKPGYGAMTIQPIKTTPGERKTLETQKMALADGTIEGTVLETDGKPAANVTVSSQVQDVHDAITDAKGRFRLTGVPRGKHFVVAGRGNSFGAGADGTTGQTDVVIHLQPEPKPVLGLVSGNLTGHQAPELKVADWTNNGPVDLRALRGRIVVIDLWAVWCGPCVASLPDVQRLSAKYASKGVTVIGIHAPGTPPEKVRQFVKTKGLTYPVALDVEESSGVGVTAKAFGFTGIPHLLVIDANGKIAADTDDVAEAEKSVQRLIGAP